MESPSTSNNVTEGGHFELWPVCVMLDARYKTSICSKAGAMLKLRVPHGTAGCMDTDDSLMSLLAGTIVSETEPHLFVPSSEGS